MRNQFYASHSQDAHTGKVSDFGSGGGGDDEKARRERQKDQHNAVNSVSMWVLRGNCPHTVESTALLVATMLSDEGKRKGFASEAYAVRAAYSAAFSRYVT